jgi:hypothetical protein
MQSLNEPISYEDAAYPVRADFADSHRRFWERLRNPGTWWTSAQRIDIASEARAAWDCPLCTARRDALSPNAVDGAHQCASSLPSAAVEAIHRMTTDASRLTRQWYEGLLADGLSEGQYIEIVGTVVSIVSIDSFALALGVAQSALPEPGDGQPTQYRPPTAGADDAWVPMVDANNADTPEADLWESGKTGNVVRAMSLVPDEVRTLKDLSAAHYLAMADVRKSGYEPGRAINRSQIELVAGRTSALNACYY